MTCQRTCLPMWWFCTTTFLYLFQVLFVCSRVQKRTECCQNKGLLVALQWMESKYLHLALNWRQRLFSCCQNIPLHALNECVWNLFLFLFINIFELLSWWMEKGNFADRSYLLLFRSFCCIIKLVFFSLEHGGSIVCWRVNK